MKYWERRVSSRHTSLQSLVMMYTLRSRDKSKNSDNARWPEPVSWRLVGFCLLTGWGHDLLIEKWWTVDDLLDKGKIEEREEKNVVSGAPRQYMVKRLKEATVKRPILCKIVAIAHNGWACSTDARGRMRWQAPGLEGR